MLKLCLFYCLLTSIEAIVDWSQLENEFIDCYNSSLCSNRNESENARCDCSDQCWDFGTCCFDKVRDEMENSPVSLETLQKRKKWECSPLVANDVYKVSFF